MNIWTGNQPTASTFDQSVISHQIGCGRSNDGKHEVVTWDKFFSQADVTFARLVSISFAGIKYHQIKVR